MQEVARNKLCCFPQPAVALDYFGVPAVGVRDAAALEAELRKALAADGPTVIEAVVNADHYMKTVFD